MALSANSVFEVRTAGNDTNGGGFVTGASGTDFSRQNSKNTVGSNISTTDAVANGTTTLTSATGNFSTAIVGNIIYLQGGTGALAAGWYQVTARASTTSITLDRVVAAGTGITMNIGGALASPGQAGAIATVAGHKVWIKAGTYNITSTTANVSGGVVSTGVSQWEGYETNRGDRSFVHPVLTASGIATATLFTLGSNDASAICIDCDGASLTAIRGFSSTVRANFLQCKATLCSNSGFNVTGAGSFLQDCWATLCSSAGAGFVGLAGALLIECISQDNTVPGFSGTGSFHRCIADSNTGASSDGFVSANQGARYINCVSYGNGRDGFRASTTDIQFYYCLTESNTGFGYNISAGTGAGCYLYICGAYNNGSGSRNGTFLLGEWNFYPGSSTFFVDAPNGDFNLLKVDEGENVSNQPSDFLDGINNTNQAMGACEPIGFPAVEVKLVGRGGLVG